MCNFRDEEGEAERGGGAEGRQEDEGREGEHDDVPGHLLRRRRFRHAGRRRRQEREPWGPVLPPARAAGALRGPEHPLRMQLLGVPLQEDQLRPPLLHQHGQYPAIKPMYFFLLQLKLLDELFSVRNATKAYPGATR